jgi:hypothetical protein
MKRPLGNQNLTMMKQGANLLKIITIVIFFIIIIFAKYDKCIPILSNFYYNSSKPIDRKFVYFEKNGRFEGCRFINECSKIRDMQLYYNGESESIDFMFGYLRPFREFEILDYYPKDSTAVLRIYNDSPRLQNEGFVIVSMKCLHDTLPSGIAERKD